VETGKRSCSGESRLIYGALAKSRGLAQRELEIFAELGAHCRGVCLVLHCAAGAPAGY